MKYKRTNGEMRNIEPTNLTKTVAMKRVIIRAYGLTADKAVKIVAMVGVDNMLKNQIDGDDSIVGFEDCMIYLTTKNRKSIRIDVCKPEVDHSNERANCYTIG